MIITLRPAVATDLMAVGAMHQRSRVAAYRHFLPAEALAVPTEDAMGRYWAARWPYERDTHLLTVAERDGVIVGFTYLGPDEADEADEADEPAEVDRADEADEPAEVDRADEADEPAEVAPASGLLCAIHLEPEQQGHGTGRMLMIDALATMHGRGWHRAALWVLHDNHRARQFYERGGWTPDGVERDEELGPVVIRQLRYVRDLP